MITESKQKKKEKEKEKCYLNWFWFDLIITGFLALFDKNKLNPIDNNDYDDDDNNKKIFIMIAIDVRIKGMLKWQ